METIMNYIKKNLKQIVDHTTQKKSSEDDGTDFDVNSKDPLQQSIKADAKSNFSKSHASKSKDEDAKTNTKTNRYEEKQKAEYAKLKVLKGNIERNSETI